MRKFASIAALVWKYGRPVAKAMFAIAKDGQIERSEAVMAASAAIMAAWPVDQLGVPYVVKVPGANLFR